MKNEPYLFVTFVLLQRLTEISLNKLLKSTWNGFIYVLKARLHEIIFNI